MRTLQEINKQLADLLKEQARWLAEYESMKDWLKQHNHIGETHEGELFWTHNKKLLTGETELKSLV